MAKSGHVPFFLISSEKFCEIIIFSKINPQAPVAQKSADEVVFRHLQGEGVEFFKSDITDPLRFLMRIFWKLPI